MSDSNVIPFRKPLVRHRLPISIVIIKEVDGQKIPCFDLDALSYEDRERYFRGELNDELKQLGDEAIAADAGG